MEGYNWELCQDRHRKIEKAEAKVDKRLKKVENRWVVLLTIMVITLLTVVGNLVVLLTRVKPPV